MTVVLVSTGSPQDHQLLVTSLTKALLPRLLSLAGMASSRKCPGCSKCLSFNNYGVHSALGNFQYSIIVLYSSPDLWLDTILSPSSAGSSFNLMAWVLPWYALSTLRSHVDRCRTLQIMSNQLNLPHVESNEGVETAERWSKEMGGVRTKFQVSQQRVWILMSKWYLNVFFVINLQLCFPFVIMGYWVSIDEGKKLWKRF